MTRGGHGSFLACAAPVLFLAAAGRRPDAQSFLGTIRGTVTDPAGSGCLRRRRPRRRRGDGRARAPSSTDAEGRFEATNLRPGTYRVEVVTTNFKKFEQTGVVLRAAGIARVDVKLELGARHRDGHRLGGGHQQHHARRATPIARGPRRAAAPRPAAQQPRHPVLPAAEPERARRQRRHPVPGRPHLRRLLHPGRPGLHERHLRHRRQLRPRPRRHLRAPGPLELLQRGVRRPRRRGRHHQARRQQLPRHRPSTTSTRTA